jgi:hypothetical protein
MVSVCVEGEVELELELELELLTSITRQARLA